MLYFQNGNVLVSLLMKPHCSESKIEDIDTGKRNELIFNICPSTALPVKLDFPFVKTKSKHSTKSKKRPHTRQKDFFAVAINYET